MDVLSTIPTDKVQKMLETYFNGFREESIGGTLFSLLPRKENTPLIERVTYDKNMDIFTIAFRYKEDVRLNRQGNVSFIEDSEGKLVGIQVTNVREDNVEEIRVEVGTTLDNKIASAKVALQMDNPRNVARLDVEKRKVDFFKDIVRDEMPELVK